MFKKKKTMTKNDRQPIFDSQNPVIYDNTRSEVILVMPDTLDNKLRDFEDCLEKKGNIFGDLGLILAFLSTLLTVQQFKDYLTIPAEVWQAIFIVFLILSVLRFFRDCYSIFVKKSIKREEILKQLLDETRKK